MSCEMGVNVSNMLKEGASTYFILPFNNQICSSWYETNYPN